MVLPMNKKRPGPRLALLFALLLLPAGPALAQRNLAGVWLAVAGEDSSQRMQMPAIGDYTGLPLNAAARLRAQSWSPDLAALPEYQCVSPAADLMHDSGDIRIREERDPRSDTLIALHLQHFPSLARRSIWLDGREHPPAHALHSTQGFSTGSWRGHLLRVTTSHLKEGSLRRNGVPRSDQATLTEYFIRHGDLLSWTVIVDDPVYLDEPYIRNREFRYSIDVQPQAAPCVVQEVLREPGFIPHFLPGQNPVLLQFAEDRRLPFEAAMGGAATLYPDYRQTLKSLPVPAARERGAP